MSVATVQDLIDTNRLIKNAKNLNYVLRIPSIPLDKMAVAAVSDSSHGNMRDGATQAGWMTVVINEDCITKESDAACIAWASHKVKRVVLSTLAAETIG